MTDLDLLLAVAGAVVTVFVVVGMILITPRGQVMEDSEDKATPQPDARRFPPNPALAPVQEAARVDGGAHDLR